MAACFNSSIFIRKSVDEGEWTSTLSQRTASVKDSIACGRQRASYRSLSESAPKWAVGLVLSQRGTLDRFDWPDWEIRGGVLYNNELHHRYYWEPVHLLLPLFGVTD